MEYQINLTWPQARALMWAGAMIRRIGWLDRWLLRIGCWEYMLYNTGEMHVVRASEFGKAEFDGSDWTTIWPDQWHCVYPDPEVPPVDPQPEPGGPISQLYQYWFPGGPPSSAKFGERLVINPFSAPAKVWLHGRADDRFHLKLTGGWSVVSTNGSSDWNYTATVDIRFLLGAGQSFWIAVSNEGGSTVKYDVTGVFTL